MEHQDKVAFIRQKAIKANPEIVELKFGCLINDQHTMLLRCGGDFGNEIMQTVDTRTGETGSYFASYIDDGNGDSRLETVEDWIKDGEIDIIGRPVRLADVLLAIGNHQDKWRETNWFTWVFPVAQELGKSGEWANFCGYSHDKGWALLTNKDKCPVGWNLRADDLEDQSEDTIEFIYSLLK